jgi:hypothetical protein
MYCANCMVGRNLECFRSSERALKLRVDGEFAITVIEFASTDAAFDIKNSNFDAVN